MLLSEHYKLGVKMNGKGSKRREGENFPLFQQNFEDVVWPADFARTKQGRMIINAPNWGKKFIPDRVPKDRVKELT